MLKLNDFSKRFFETLIQNPKLIMTLTQHGKNPMDIIWYYVERLNDYFPFIEYHGNVIVLGDDPATGDSFEVSYNECRVASYDEVRAFYNKNTDG